MLAEDVQIARGGAELLDDVRPLWLALRTHHNAIAPELGPVRDDEDSWRRRRAQYRGWLADPRAFILIARHRTHAVGYAFARVDEASSPTWRGEHTYLDLETLSVLPEARGAGVGRRLIALVREEVERRGYEELRLTAVATNRDALRFYEREGFTPMFIILRDSRRRR
jgi:ribosomal protein S18 acetylase RimI-like enzyme